MKKIALVLMVMLCSRLFAQPPGTSVYYQCINNNKIAKEDVVLLTGYDKEVEDNIKWALDKFWICSKVKTEDKNTYKDSPNKSYISVDEFKHTGQDGNFYNTQYSLSNLKAGISGVSKGFTLAFDNISNLSSKDDIIGADKTKKIIACKALSYTMMLCAVMKNYNPKDGKMSGKEILAKMASNKERLKTTTVLIPKELFDNGVTKDALSELTAKYEIATSEQIAQRIKEGTKVKNYSNLILVKQDKFISYAYILDLETGDILYSSSSGATALNKTFVLDDKLVKKLLHDSAF